MAPDEAGLDQPGGVLDRPDPRAQGRPDGPGPMVPAPDPQRLVSIEPAVEAAVSFSGDGRYVFIRPEEMLPPDTTYKVTVSGLVTTGGPRLGNVSWAPAPSNPSAARSGPTGDDGNRVEPEGRPRRDLRAVDVAPGSPDAADADQPQPDRLRLLRLDRRRSADRAGRHGGVVRGRQAGTRKARSWPTRRLGSRSLCRARSAAARSVDRGAGQPVVHVRAGPAAPLRPARDVRR